MSTLKSNVIEPATGTDLSLGAAGDLIDVTSDTLQLNTWKDSGGNTLFVSDGSGNLSSINSALDIGGGPNLITTATCNGSSSVEFTTGIDSTYDKYMFVFINIHPSSNGYSIRFQGSIDSNSSFVDMTSTSYYGYGPESGTGNLAYYTAGDVANGTPTLLTYAGMGADDDQSLSGELYLFAPSNTTYVKHWYARTIMYGESNEAFDVSTSGWFDTTSAINSVKFDMSGGTMDTGTIKMYGCR